MNKKAIVFLLVFAMVIVACGDTTEEVAVEATEEEEHDHEDESTLEQVQERGFLKCGVSTGATGFTEVADSYTHLTLPTNREV